MDFVVQFTGFDSRSTMLQRCCVWDYVEGFCCGEGFALGLLGLSGLFGCFLFSVLVCGVVVGRVFGDVGLVVGDLGEVG